MQSPTTLPLIDFKLLLQITLKETDDYDNIF